MLQRIRFSTLQAGLLLFWAAWLTLMGITNLLEGMKLLGALPDGWTLASNSFGRVSQAAGTSVAIAAVTFGVVIAWELLAAGLFWRAWNAVRRGAEGTADEVTQAFFVGLALWGALLVASEATQSFATAGTHRGMLIAQLVTLLLLRAGTRAVAVPVLEARPSAADRAGIGAASG
jgi:hypothetical protein